MRLYLKAAWRFVATSPEAVLRLPFAISVSFHR
jgi:hypothetical protein